MIVKSIVYILIFLSSASFGSDKLDSIQTFIDEHKKLELEIIEFTSITTVKNLGEIKLNPKKEDLQKKVRIFDTLVYRLGTDPNKEILKVKGSLKKVWPKHEKENADVNIDTSWNLSRWGSRNGFEHCWVNRHITQLVEKEVAVYFVRQKGASLKDPTISTHFQTGQLEQVIKMIEKAKIVE